MKEYKRILVRNSIVNGQYESDIAVSGGKIAAVGKSLEFEADFVIDAKGLYSSAGFVDIHTHGGKGIDIVRCTDSELDELTEFYATCGVTSFLPTIGTAEMTEVEEAIKKIARLAENGARGAKPIGIHLEGPYLSKDYCGAQPTKYFRKLGIDEFDRLYDIAPGLIKLVTIAPELDGAISFINHISKKGVVASIGHTGATYDECIRAINAGAKSTTHMLNGMRSFHQHEPSILGAAVLSDIYCEMICDGFHLHPATVKMLLRIKGPERLVLVTDSIMAAGLPDGTYEGFITVVVENGDAKLHSGSRAGSTLKANHAVKNVIKFSDMNMETAIPMMTESPAELIGAGANKGKLKMGYDADMILFDENFDIKLTMVEGNLVYESL